MTSQQRFILTIVLGVLVIAGIAGFTAVLITNGVKVDQSPTLLSVLGTFTTVTIVLVGLVQNQTITATTTEVKTLVNGGLVARVEQLVEEALHAKASVEAVAQSVLPPAPATAPTDPHASAGA